MVARDASTGWWVSGGDGAGRVVVASDWWAALGQVLRDEGVLPTAVRMSARVRDLGVVVRVDEVTWTVRPHIVGGLAGELPDLAAACARALDAAVERAPSESGAVLVTDGPYLRFVVARGPYGQALRGVRIPATAGVAGHALRTQRGIVVGERSALRLDSTLERLTGQRPREAMAVPLSVGGVPLGVLELVNPPESRGYRVSELHGVEAIGTVLAAWIRRHRPAVRGRD